MGKRRNTLETLPALVFPAHHDPIWRLGAEVVQLLVDYVNGAVRA